MIKKENKIENEVFICKFSECEKIYTTKRGCNIHQNYCIYNLNRKNGKRKCYDIQYVLDLYFKEEKGCPEIAKLYSEKFKEKTGKSIIRNWIKNAGYNLRSGSEAQNKPEVREKKIKSALGKNNQRYKGIVNHSTIHDIIRREKPYPYTDDTKQFSRCSRCGRVFKEGDRYKKIVLAYLKPHQAWEKQYYSFYPEDYQYMCRVREDISGYKQLACHQTFDKRSFWNKWTEENWSEYLKSWLPFRELSWSEYCKKHLEYKI